jgi:hypothetical protein
MAFDPNPARRPSVIPRKRVPQANEVSPIDPPPPRDYFTGRPPSKSHREVLREDRPSSSRSVSTERESSFPPQSAGGPKASPHIAYQEKGRGPNAPNGPKRLTSGQSTPASSASPAVGGAEERPERPKPRTLDTSSFTLGRGEGFKLQEVPKTKKSSSRSDLGKENRSPSLVSPIEAHDKQSELDRTVTASPVSAESPQSGINPFDDPRRKEGQNSAQAPSLSRFPDRPARGDSLAASSLQPSSSHHMAARSLHLPFLARSSIHKALFLATTHARKVWNLLRFAAASTLYHPEQAVVRLHPASLSARMEPSLHHDCRHLRLQLSVTEDRSLSAARNSVAIPDPKVSFRPHYEAQDCPNITQMAHSPWRKRWRESSEEIKRKTEVKPRCYGACQTLSNMDAASVTEGCPRMACR